MPLPSWRVWGWSSSSFLSPSLASPRPAPLSPYRQACHPPLGFLRCPSSCSIPFHPPFGPCSGSSKPSPGILTPLVMTIIEYVQTPNQRPPGVWLFPPGPLGGPSPTSPTLPGHTSRSPLLLSSQTHPHLESSPIHHLSPFHPPKPCQEALAPAEVSSMTLPITRGPCSLISPRGMENVDFYTDPARLHYLSAALFRVPLTRYPAYHMCQTNVSITNLLN